MSEGVEEGGSERRTDCWRCHFTCEGVSEGVDVKHTVAEFRAASQWSATAINVGNSE